MNHITEKDLEKALKDYDLWQDIRGNLSDWGMGRLLDGINFQIDKILAAKAAEVAKLEIDVPSCSTDGSECGCELPEHTCYNNGIRAALQVLTPTSNEK